jgi:hypothetical protein
VPTDEADWNAVIASLDTASQTRLASELVENKQVSVQSDQIAGAGFSQIDSVQ